MDKLVAADASQGPFGALSVAQLAQQGSNFYNVENPMPDAHMETTAGRTTGWKTAISRSGDESGRCCGSGR